MEFHPVDKPTDDPAWLIPRLIAAFKPKSVIDFGCNQGAYLAEFMKQGVIDVIGVDGDNMEPALMIPRSQFIAWDLRFPLSLEGGFDLALCIEVGEHLPGESSTQLVETLCRHSNTVIFGAAHPGQGGYEHINEQPASYWVKRFEEFSYEGKPAAEVIGPIPADASHWLRENLWVYRIRSR